METQMFSILVSWPNPMVTLVDKLTLCKHKNDASDVMTVLSQKRKQ